MSLDLDTINQPPGQHLKPEQVDNVARALISLTRDVCVLTDRLAILEQVLGDKGIDVAELVDTYEPSGAVQKDIAERTQTIINDVVCALRGE